ncbi:MAG: hypothetical protein K8R92_01130 [Planctomycetes bacterium]|nr:hypothetical protein [Planctomycetota bacterium]
MKTSSHTSHFVGSLFVAVASFLAATVHAQDLGDIVPVRIGGVIETREYIPDDSGDTRPRRVFPAEFGESGVEHSTSEPGYEAPPGSFDPGTRMGWNALDGLRRWDGSDFVPATGLQMHMSYLTLQFDIRESAVNGFDLQVQSNGGIHKHLNMEIAADTAPLPDTGAYLIKMELYSTDSSAAVSEPYWIVFNDGLAPEEFEPIYAWAEANLLAAPCPFDLDGSGEVDGGDLGLVLLDFGPCPGCTTDLDGSGEVDGGDLGLVLLNFGSCP